MGFKVDLTDREFGRLRVLEYAGKNLRNKTLWKCLCDPRLGGCGNYKDVEADKLTRKESPTRSCGCLSDEKRRERCKNFAPKPIIHGHGIKGKESRTFLAWQSMIQRCSPSAKGNNLKNYYGRGIRVCDQWLESKGRGFINFLEDMGECPEGLTIERVDNDGNYEPSNCRWATVEEQAKNRRSNIIIEHNGQRMIASDWARLHEIRPSVFTDWIREHGKDEAIKRALSKTAFNQT